MNSRVSSLNLEALIKECVGKAALETEREPEEVFRESWHGLVRWVR